MVEKMISKLVESGTEVPKWVLTSFANKAKLRAKTGDPEILKRNLRRLRYRGGGSLPEPAYAGVICTLNINLEHESFPRDSQNHAPHAQKWSDPHDH